MNLSKKREKKQKKIDHDRWVQEVNNAMIWKGTWSLLCKYDRFNVHNMDKFCGNRWKHNAMRELAKFPQTWTHSKAQSLVKHNVHGRKLRTISIEEMDMHICVGMNLLDHVMQRCYMYMQTKQVKILSIWNSKRALNVTKWSLLCCKKTAAC